MCLLAGLQTLDLLVQYNGRFYKTTVLSVSVKKWCFQLTTFSCYILTFFVSASDWHLYADIPSSLAPLKIGFSKAMKRKSKWSCWWSWQCDWFSQSALEILKKWPFPCYLGISLSSWNTKHRTRLYDATNFICSVQAWSAFLLFSQESHVLCLELPLLGKIIVQITGRFFHCFWSWIIIWGQMKGHKGMDFWMVVSIFPKYCSLPVPLKSWCHSEWQGQISSLPAVLSVAV